MEDIPATSGIYKITCTANKKFYIGSAVNLSHRQWDHFSFLRRNKHKNPHLQRAWNKYGEPVFTFEVLEFVLPISLTAREQYWFKKLKPFGKRGFNIAHTAGSNLGMKQSLETIAKRAATLAVTSKKRSPEAIEKSRLGNLGKKMSPEAIEKMRQSKLGKPPHNRGKKASLETREKQRQSKLGKKRSLESVEKQMQTRRTKRVLRAAQDGKTGMFVVLIPKDNNPTESQASTDERLILYVNNKGA